MYKIFNAFITRWKYYLISFFAWQLIYLNTFGIEGFKDVQLTLIVTLSYTIPFANLAYHLANRSNFERTIRSFFKGAGISLAAWMIYFNVLMLVALVSDIAGSS